MSNLTLWYTTLEVRFDILDFRVKCIVDVATDIEIELILFYLGNINKAGIFWYFEFISKDVVDFFNVFWTEEVLIATLAIFRICIDKKNFSLRGFFLLFVDDEHTRRDTCTIKKVLW